QYVRDFLKAHPESDYVLPQEVVDKTIDKYLEAYKLLTGREL
ncbi:MAG: phosphoribosylaminoimidazolesuccinocarboxamide synthase, partial [Lachnospiraceae bacterium]|nr:phosphoribosylaminoimidazolesuccinocarboxamide synthase [Lachnospiraceae bacterium]